MTASGFTARSILDFGCGDAYTGRKLLDGLGADALVGVDVHLTPEQCAAYASGDDRISLHRDISELGERRFDLALLCDVIEHVEDDVGLLKAVTAHVAAAGRVMVTVPAFQLLFSQQDFALKHHRRYSLGLLEQRLAAAGLGVSKSGYLFGSLLYVRTLEKAVELVGGARGGGEGIGAWSGGAVLTRLLSGMLDLDNSLLLALAERKVKLPGLSCWALCTPADPTQG